MMRELSVERIIDAPPSAVWTVMTDRMPEWWCPKPWTAKVIELDWRAGGRSAMVMHGPNGEAMPNEGVFLEVTPGVRFVFTDAFTAGWQPEGPFIVGIWEIAAEGASTRYRASPGIGPMTRWRATATWASRRAGARRPIS